MSGFNRIDAEPLRVKGRRNRWKVLAKRLLTALFGEYQLFRIYRYDFADVAALDLTPFLAQGYEFREVSAADLASVEDEEIRSRVHYCGENAVAFAVYQGGAVVCVQWYWFGERYRRRNFWPLETSQAKSVELFTVASHRGKGLATAVKVYSAKCMKQKGFSALFSRIWYSHAESCRVSEKAGWKNVAIVIEFAPLGLGRTVRLVHRTRLGQPPKDRRTALRQGAPTRATSKHDR